MLHRNRNFKLELNTIGLIFLLAWSLTCQAPPPKSAPVQYWPSEGGGQGPVLDHVAKFLAGRPLPETSSLYAKTKTAWYKEHALWMNDFFEKVRSRHIAPITSWRNAHLPAKTTTAIYPLSGADFTNLYAMYPSADTYLMFALEEPGSPYFPNLNNDHELQGQLKNMRIAIQSVAGRNYFYTASMKWALSATQIGLRPVLLTFMSGLNFTIERMTDVRLQDNGTLTARTVEAKATATQTTQATPTANTDGSEIYGLEIDFVVNGSPRKLTYLKLRVDRHTADLNTPEGKFLAQYNNFHSMMKSAVYLLHFDRYKSLRDFLLARADIIVQDDSCIPWRFFEGTTWDRQLFGVFTQSAPLIEIDPYVPQQPDLIQEYQKGNPEQLPFTFGYGILLGQGRSNLQLMVRK